jgi:hypothetical protein
MTEWHDAQKRAQLDRLLNDPDVTMEPDEVWSLLAEVVRAERAITVRAGQASVLF